MMRSTDLCRAEHAPFCTEPEIGQRSDNLTKPALNEATHVFQADETRSHVASDLRDDGRQPSIVVSNQAGKRPALPRSGF